MLIMAQVRLQESSNESTYTDHGASDSTHGGSSTGRLSSTASRGSALISASGAWVAVGASGGSTASAGTATRWCNTDGAENKSSGVVCAHDEGLGAVDASGALDGDSLHARRDGGDGCQFAN